jgi:signal transduction histidine kinase
MRFSTKIRRASGWRPVRAYSGSENDPATVVFFDRGRWGWPRRVFLGWYLASFLAWNWAVIELRMHRLVGPGVPAFSLLLWPVIVVACALPVALLWERRLEERHQREITEIQRQRQEANLKLLVLQAQIEPHFLFNTLASLRALLREDVIQAETMVDALVRHLRAVLPIMRSDSGVSTLSDQLAICVSYLELMVTRLEGRFTYRVDVPDALLHAPFPPLMLLTLVENAIKHGIEPKAGDGRICIEARLVGCSILARVIDDGVGLSPGLGGGLGLRNVREQLTLWYGEQAALSLSSPPEGGAVACIQIPVDGIHIR